MRAVLSSYSRRLLVEVGCEPNRTGTSQQHFLCTRARAALLFRDWDIIRYLTFLSRAEEQTAQAAFRKEARPQASSGSGRKKEDRCGCRSKHSKRSWRFYLFHVISDVKYRSQETSSLRHCVTLHNITQYQIIHPRQIFFLNKNFFSLKMRKIMNFKCQKL